MSGERSTGVKALVPRACWMEPESGLGILIVIPSRSSFITLASDLCGDCDKAARFTLMLTSRLHRLGIVHWRVYGDSPS
jgi:hypothetical protein